MTNIDKKNHTVVYIILAIVLAGFITVGLFGSNFNKILYEPLQGPEVWLETHPYIEIGDIIISEPSSSVIVFLLTALTIWIGSIFLRKRQDHHFLLWWGLSLILTGLGAGLAGVSYQAFSFEIKCRGLEYCLWTSWWEVAYMICTVAGVSAAFIGIACFLFSPKAQKFWTVYALASAFIYVTLASTGTFLADRFLISFEFMVLFIAIGLFAITVQCLWFYYREKNPDVLKIIWIGAGIASVITIYFIALISDFASLLWAKGIWFNENDLLHVLMIGWVLLVYKVLGKTVTQKKKIFR